MVLRVISAVMIAVAGIAAVVIVAALAAPVALDVRDRVRAWRYYRRTGKEWWRGIC